MAIEQVIWKLTGSAGEPPRKLRPAGLADEGLLEEQIMQDVAILNRDWLLIGRQVRTAFDKLVDLLAIDYASWVVTLADYQLIDKQGGTGAGPPASTVRSKVLRLFYESRLHNSVPTLG
ncbi:hypothetical protein [Halomonas sp. C05BenzN]|uniref:hypothetical protein n=1 Tax=Halomonas sp. C05BenzN TaxID=3411041 RepID=UPI003B95B412